MYGLKQAGLMATQLLQKRLAPFLILSSSSYSWTLAAQNKTSIILTYCKRFSREVCGKRKHRAPKKRIDTQL
jgi:hypothetical protein